MAKAGKWEVFGETSHVTVEAARIGVEVLPASALVRGCQGTKRVIRGTRVAAVCFEPREFQPAAVQRR